MAKAKSNKSNKTSGKPRKSRSNLSAAATTPKAARISRPPNRFILFRSYICSEIDRRGREAVLSEMPDDVTAWCRTEINGFAEAWDADPSKNPGGAESLSKVIGRWWKNLPLSEHTFWQGNAAESKRRHQEVFQDYQFKPSRTRSKKKASKPHEQPKRVVTPRAESAMTIPRGHSTGNVTFTPPTDSYAAHGYGQAFPPYHHPPPEYSQKSVQQVPSSQSNFMSNTNIQRPVLYGMLQPTHPEAVRGGQGTHFVPNMSHVASLGPSSSQAHLYSLGYNQHMWSEDQMAAANSGAYGSGIHTTNYQLSSYFQQGTNEYEDVHEVDCQMPGNTGFSGLTTNQPRDYFQPLSMAQYEMPSGPHTSQSTGNGVNSYYGWADPAEGRSMPSPFAVSNATSPEGVEGHRSSTGGNWSCEHFQQEPVVSSSNVHLEAHVPMSSGDPAFHELAAYSWESKLAFASAFDPTNFDLGDAIYYGPEGFEMSAEINDQSESNNIASDKGDWNHHYCI